MTTNPVMSQTTHVPDKWQPRGRGRDPAAMCFIQGPKMEAEMLSTRSRASLRSVDPSQTRDASAPILTTQNDHDAEIPEQYPRYNHAFLNRPREGDFIEDRFWLEYINGHTLDGKIRVLMRRMHQEDSSEGDEELVLENELDKDANGLKWLLKRPADMKAGQYTLVVQKQVKDGSFQDDATATVVIA